MTTAQATTGARLRGREQSRDYRARRHFLGRSAWLAYHAPEQKKPSRVVQIAKAFDLIEPLAATLRNKGRTGARGRELLRHIGNVLAIQHKMVGRVETGEKPELLWEYPGLERLYVRLADEYELRDRDRALDRKLDVISRTVETLLELVQTRSSLRVEWYIVLLIVAELILAGYTSLFHR
jgi:uncharacterized Rmd1/YagE family protein